MGTHGRKHLAGERACHARDPRPRRQVGALVAAQHPERQIRRARGVGSSHARMRVLLELERRRPAMLDGIPQPVERTDAGIAAPREDELARSAGAD
jgi:hypothetical protein